MLFSIFSPQNQDSTGLNQEKKPSAQFPFIQHKYLGSIGWFRQVILEGLNLGIDVIQGSSMTARQRGSEF